MSQIIEELSLLISLISARLGQLPVTPRPQHNSKEDDEEGYIRTPHDNGHGIQAKDGPGWKDWGGHRCGATRLTAVLTWAGPRAVIQRLSTVKRLVAHGSHAFDGFIWGDQIFLRPILYTFSTETDLSRILKCFQVH